VNDIYIQEDTFLYHLKTRSESRPDFNVVMTNLVALGRVKEVPSNLLELDSLQQSVEEYFVKH
jgi:hypothetical protein